MDIPSNYVNRDVIVTMFGGTQFTGKMVELDPDTRDLILETSDPYRTKVRSFMSGKNVLEIAVII